MRSKPAERVWIKYSLFIFGAGLSLGYFFSLPTSLFRQSYSTVLRDRSDQLLSAAVATDGQWRFPEQTDVPGKFARAIVAFEDKRFWDHPGLDLLAIGRAMRQNIAAGKVVSGGSTLSMQVVRLSRGNPPRSFFQKIVEMILATRLELRYSKKEILNLYAAHAPFGGNVVGLEAACWRYFGRNSNELSWGEAALLAVLPNNPSLIHLARNRDKLKVKRDRLLTKLYHLHEMDELSYKLALTEPIPDKPKLLPNLARHLLGSAVAQHHAQQVIRSTIDGGLQSTLEQVVDDYARRLGVQQVYNAAVLVVDTKTGEVIAYVGNARTGREHQENVDIIRSRRSTGSILKPFLYAAMLEEGKILPGTLIPDVPVLIGGFAPRNFSRHFDGVVPADQALIRSLNVPAILELRDYRYEKFYDLLGQLGMTTLNFPPDHYGLSLVLGGAEGTLWDITGMYASMARALVNYFDHPGALRYNPLDYHALSFVKEKENTDESPELEQTSFLSASSIWLTFQALKELYRPGEQTGWQHFGSARPVAWKTGTSFGLRDGWAVGATPEYTVGVWVGNADGEGRPGLTGTELAAPLLFSVFSGLPGTAWFQKPESELVDVPVCRLSGQRASLNCEALDTLAVTKAGLNSPPCSYHKKIHLTNDGRYRVHADCERLDKMKTVNWFVLPPVQEYYYKASHLSYRSLPPLRRDCSNPSSVASMELLYPRANSKIYLPVQLNGLSGGILFEAAHLQAETTIYWHLDGQFIGATQGVHQLTLTPARGRHLVTLIDDSGETLQLPFEVISGR